MELLAVCITTYKRNEVLVDILTEMLECLIKYSIPVYINDNDEDSKLEENKLFQDIIIKYKKIYYKKNKPSLSIDENLMNILERSSSKYSLWLGDDDYIFSTDLERLYLKLESTEYDLVILNKSEVTREELKELKLHQNIKLKLYNEKKKGEYNNLDSFFEKNYDNFRYGCLVVRNEYLNKVELSRYYGTYHCYIGFIFETLFYLEREKKNISISVVDEIVIYMLKIKKNWEEVKWEAIIGEIDFFMSISNDKYKQLILKKYFGGRKRKIIRYIGASENLKYKLKLEEFEEKNFKNKIFENFFLKMIAKIYVILRKIYRRTNIKYEKI